MMRRKKLGFTLTEMIVTLALIGGVIFLSRSAINFLNLVARQKKTSQQQLDSEVAIFNMVRDVRNAKAIGQVDFDRIVLRTFDVRRYGYASRALFDDVNIGTTTYIYKEVGADRYLEKTVYFPSGGGTTTRVKLLLNTIVPPDATNYLFRGGPNTFPPYDTIEIDVRIKSPWGKGEDLTYQELVMRRASI